MLYIDLFYLFNKSLINLFVCKLSKFINTMHVDLVHELTELTYKDIQKIESKKTKNKTNDNIKQ